MHLTLAHMSCAIVICWLMFADSHASKPCSREYYINMGVMLSILFPPLLPIACSCQLPVAHYLLPIAIISEPLPVGHYLHLQPVTCYPAPTIICLLPCMF